MSIQNFDKWVEIKDGELMKRGELSHRMAIALYPNHDEGIGYEFAKINIDIAIRKALDDGELVVRNSVCRGRDNLPCNDSIILPHELRPFLEASGIGLRLMSPVSPAAAPTVMQKIRKNSLDAPIKKAIKKAESIETGAVYLELRALALDCESPFTGEFDGNALLYTKDDNKTVAKLSKPALGKRLKKHTLQAG